VSEPGTRQATPAPTGPGAPGGRRAGRSKRLRAGLRRAAIGLGLPAAVGFLLLLFPYPLFPHTREVGGLRLHSDAELGPEVDTAMRDAWQRVLAMELHRPDARYTLFLCRSERLYRLYCRLTRTPPVTQGLIVSSLTRTVILSATGIQRMRQRTGGDPPHSRFEGSLAAAIAHEVAHLQAASAVGPRRNRSLPPWKSEGWADYSAHRARILEDTSHDLARRVELLRDDARWGGPYPSIDRRHFRWQLLVEFLVDVKGSRFADLVEDGVTEDDAWAELTRHARQRREGQVDLQVPER
jgi:hypothetical protein